MAVEMSLEDILSSSIVEWINSTDFDLESTCTSPEEVTVSHEVLPAVCTATIEAMHRQSKNASSADSSSSSSKCPAIVS